MRVRALDHRLVGHGGVRRGGDHALRQHRVVDQRGLLVQRHARRGERVVVGRVH